MNYSNVNDLGWISKYLNIGLFTLPIIFVMILFGLLYKTVCARKIYSSLCIPSTRMDTFISSVWILGNQKFKIILIS
jgi:hypothetical protein